MAKKGGKRPGAGRPRFAGDLKHEEARALLALNSTTLVTKAIALATNEKAPNMMLLSKLLDKVLPSLTLGRLDVDANVKNSLKSIPEEQLKQMIKAFAKTNIKDIHIKDGE